MKDETKEKPIKKLTAKEKMFCELYVEVGFNASEAARKAGYSEKTAYAIGAENLRKPHIKEEVERIKAEKVEEMGLNSNRLLYELGKDLAIDPSSVFKEDEKVLAGFLISQKRIKDLPKALRQAIKKITITASGEAVLEFHDRRKNAMDMLAKYNNLFEGHNQSKASNIPVLLSFNDKPSKEENED